MPENEQEKTEPASQHRRQEEQEKGNIPRSQDLQSAAALIAGLVAISSCGRSIAEYTAGFCKYCFTNAGTATLAKEDLSRAAFAGGMAFFKMVGPPVAIIMAAGVISSLVQTGPVFSTRSLAPNFSRLNIFSGMGIKSLVSAKSLVQLGFGVVKLWLVFRIGFDSIAGALPRFMMLSDCSPAEIAEFCAGFTLELLLKIAATLFVLSLIDYGYQRWRYEREIRMTKEEVKEEAKRYEGNSMVKARIRSLQMQLSRQRMMTDVPKADVVITNPTHLAVAVQYDMDKMKAPVVVAKGANLMAGKIRELARLHGVALVENKPLARTLFKKVEVGQPIPPKLYQAVAEVLAYVYQLNRKRSPGTAYAPA